MDQTAHRAIAVVGVGAILPDAPSAAAFFQNLKDGRYSISEVAPSRWDPARYYDADPKAPDKTYSKIGGWVRDWSWEPQRWGLAVPPRVSDAMDDGQKWAVACAHAALLDYGYPTRRLDTERTAVVLGNAMAGERHYETALRIYLPEYADELGAAPSFSALPSSTREAIAAELRRGVDRRLPRITEDTMPGELSNCIAGRIANLFNFHGPNYVVDAACASAMAAISAASEGLVEDDYDVVIAGGIDRNMGASAYVKFSKIGALSATGTRPYADGADGFVMGEGGVIFVLKRLADAERDGDRVYAVIRGIGGSSDGKGKGITAPNPVGQRLCIERAWRAAGLSPASATLVEGHGTSTKVGDVVECGAIGEVFAAAGARPGSVALGSVKSNIGHLKAAAGAAGLLKVVLALHEKVLPPSLHFDRPNPNIDFERSPLRVNTALRPWDVPAGGVRAAGVSAFGFGGTNFHVVVEEHVPGRLPGRGARTSVAVPATAAVMTAEALKGPLRGALVVGAEGPAALREALAAARQRGGAPAEADLRAPERLVIEYGDEAELAARRDRALRALEGRGDDPGTWRPLRSQGVFRGRGAAPRVAFLYTGQGSQYANMLRRLRDLEPIVRDTFAEADEVMAPLLGRPLSAYLFVNDDDASLKAAEEALRQTAITQPAVLATDIALTRLLGAYGVRPDFVMGHSLGEYGALVAAGALSFSDALVAVSARGREMSDLTVADNGQMAAIFAPLPEIERILATIDGYVVIANVNSTKQAVIGGASAAVQRAVAAFKEAGLQAVPLPVSHAFHTSIVAPASEPLRRTLQGLRLRPPAIPVFANVSGEPYPMGEGAEPEMIELLSRQVAAPVQFVKGLHALYEAGARLFIEVGPKKALQGFVDDVFAGRGDVASLYTNHPKLPDEEAFNQALCGLYAAGLGLGAKGETAARITATPAGAPAPQAAPVIAAPAPRTAPVSAGTGSAPVSAGAASTSAGAAGEVPLGRLALDFLRRGLEIVGHAPPDAPVVISGAALGLPGSPHVFDDGNVGRILRGEQLIDVVPARFRRAMLDKHITRLVKSDAGGPTFEAITDPDEVIRLAARAGHFDLSAEFAVPADRLPALDVVTRLAIGAGLDALRDAGIPLVLRYKTTSKGTRLPERWGLPDALRDDTGVIFASAFPGLDSFAADLSRYHADLARRERLEALLSLRGWMEGTHHGDAIAEVDRRVAELRAEIEREAYQFDRRFLFRVLAMGHSQFAELIGARGPNTQVNSACASTTQAVAIASDWIRVGRCRRVIIIAGDDVTSDHLLEWMGSGFLASGAAATDDVVEAAAVPFDRRRHGMILGMGAAAIVVESAASAAERGLRPLCEVLATVTANSAFHGTRLDVSHICDVMERAISDAEARGGVDRRRMAAELVFLSHETYTPARGGSAAAEIHALRQVFGDAAGEIVIANTKGFTGHPMGVGIEDVVAIKALETGLVPPVPNFREVDPELGPLNLSRGGAYPIRFALRLGAGFGSQISMAVLGWTAAPGPRPGPEALGYAYRVSDRAAWDGWLRRISGDAEPQLEVVGRTLRVHDRGVAHAAHGEALRPAATASSAVTTVVLSGQTPTRAAALAAPAPTPAAPAPAPAAPPTAAAGADAEVRARVMALVADKTGYAEDMLDLDLDLEADLGVDTVKQAEVFAAIRQAYGIPRDDKLKLRDYPTLAHVIRFVHERRTDRPAAPTAPAQAAPAEGAPAAPATQPAPAQAQAQAQARDDEVKARVLALVADKTGYAEDMLDLDLDLEADLGVDTVKQAEVFAAIRQAYAIPRDEHLKLRDYPTLGHVIRFVHERRTDRPTANQPAAGAAAPQAAAASDGDGAGAAHAPAAQAPAPTRRVPIPVLRPPMAWCQPTGVTLGAGRRVLVAADRGGAADALTARLGAAGVEVLRIDPAADNALDALPGWIAAGPLHGVFWLPALDAEGPVEEMDPPSWRAALRLRVKRLYATMRALFDQIAASGTFLLAGTRLDGQHGYGDGARNPLGGAVTGFLKAYRRERPEALVKAVDFTEDAGADEIAAALLEEATRDPGALEVGRRGGQRWAVGVVEEPLPAADPALALGKDSVVLVTGAAGGIVSAIIADLAACGGIFYLLDKAPAPDAADPDLRRFATDREGLKRDLFERLKARGERATPTQVERQLAALERAQAAQAALDAVRAAGGSASYHSVDLTDAVAVAAVLGEVRARSGRIDVLLHAAGLDISRALVDKEPAEFDLVFDVKSDGWFNLLRAAGDLPIGATVAFSSVAGRFGNAGQTDYCAANDLLCKLASALRRSRPALRALAIDWTAWGGIGMASRGSIPRVMEQAGIEMLPKEAGVPVVGRELRAGSRGEVVIGGRLGLMMGEWAPGGGIDAGAIAAPPLLGRVTAMGIYGGLSAETTLDPAAQPFLHDHQIDGAPVLPGVVGMELFAQLAALPLPGWHVRAIEGVDFLAPLKFYHGEPRTLRLTALLSPEGEDVVARCALIGSRELPGHGAPQETTHFRGRVRLCRAAAPAERAEAPKQPDGTPGSSIAPADIYRIYFHGPAYRVIGAAWPQGDGACAALASDLPPGHAPADAPLLTAPRLVELCFQAAGLADLARDGVMALPQHVDRLTLGPLPATGRCVAVVRTAAGGADARVLGEDGGVLLTLEGYRTVRVPGALDEALLQPLRAMLPPR